MTELTQERLAAAILDKLDTSEFAVDRLRIVPKGEDVWIAYVRFNDGSGDRQGVFTREQLDL